MVSVFTATGAVFCVWLLLASSIGSLGTTDITIEVYDDYLTPAEYHTSIFGQKTFSFDLTEATGDVNIVVRITGVLNDELVQFWADGSAPETLGILEPDAQWNVFILPLDRSDADTYKLRLMGNADMHFFFSIYNASQPPEINGYTQVIGYPLPSNGDSVDIDAKPGWAYQLSLQGIEFGQFNYELERNNNGAYYTGEILGHSLRTQYIPPDFTGIRLYKNHPDQAKYTLRFIPTPVLPSVGEGNVYTDLEEGKVHIRLSQTDYIDLINSYEPLEGQPLGEWVTSYIVDSDGVTLYKESLGLVSHPTGLVVENDLPQPESFEFGEQYFVEYLPFESVYESEPITFVMLTEVEITDADGDSLPIITFNTREFSSDGNGAVVIGEGLLTEELTPALDINDQDGQVPDSWRDFDGDYLGTVGEVQVFGTNPLEPDSDEDELDDQPEVMYWNGLAEAHREESFEAGSISTWFYDSHPDWDESNDFKPPPIKSQELLDYYLQDEAPETLNSIYLPQGDIDGDGIINVLDNDADGDLLLDGAEYGGIGGPECEATLLGVTIADLKTLPFHPDSDMDGIFDGHEVFSLFPVMVVKGEDAESGSFLATEVTDSEYGVDFSPSLIENQNHNLNFQFTPIYSGIHIIQLKVRAYTDKPEEFGGENPRTLEDLIQVELKDSTGSTLSQDENSYTDTYKISDNFITNDDFTLEDHNLQGVVGYAYDLNVGVDPPPYDLKVTLKEDLQDNDRIEVAIDEVSFLQRSLHPLDPDFDDDGLGDGDLTLRTEDDTLVIYTIGEANSGTLPLNADTDGDGLADGGDDGEIDLGDLENAAGFTDPTTPDTDGDGLLDGPEQTINADVSPHLVSRYLKLDLDHTQNLNDYTFQGEIGEIEDENTDPLLFDTDNDGLLDGKSKTVPVGSDRYWQYLDIIVSESQSEISYEEIYKLRLQDVDQDGLWEEVFPIDYPTGYVMERLELKFYGESDVETEPLNADTDNDGLPDGWEKKYGFYPTVGGGGDDDADSDGLTNLEEYVYGQPTGWDGIYWDGTDPNDPDTDGDTLIDGESFTIDYDNRDDDLRYDTWEFLYYNTNNNGDRTYYGEEDYSTDSRMGDTDNDKLPDLWEIVKSIGRSNAFDPTDPADAEADFDNDGLTNYNEFIHGRELGNKYMTYLDGLDPWDPDKDNDGLLDGYWKVLVNETQNHIAIDTLISHDIVYTVDEAGQGDDDDVYTFYGEGYFGSEINDDDTDDDLLPDGKQYIEEEWVGEWIVGTDPASVDSDGDGLLDGASISSETEIEAWENIINKYYITPDEEYYIYYGEQFKETNPTLVDTDNDLLWDGIEVLQILRSLSYADELWPTDYDSDDDLLPDGVEPLWNVNMDPDSDDLPNFLDECSGGCTTSDTQRTKVVFRTTDLEYDDETLIAVWLDDGGDELERYSYDGEVQDLSDLTPRSYVDNNGNNVPLLTPDGRTILYEETDNKPNIFIVNCLDESAAHFVYDDTLNAPSDSRTPQEAAAKALLESYDWSEYLSTDDDNDGIDNSAENTEGGYEIIINGIAYTVETDDGDPDTDGDGLLDGSDLVIAKIKFNNDAKPNPNWPGHNGSDLLATYPLFWDDYDESNYIFYGEVTWGTHPGEADYDDDGILDGFTIDITGSDSRYEDWDDAGYKHTTWTDTETTPHTTWYRFFGELSLGTDPFNSDTDGDGLEDGYEVTYDALTDEEGLQSLDPLSADTDGDEISDYDEINGYGGYQTNPYQWDTDGDEINDKMEIDGWTIFLIANDGTRTESTVYGDPNAEFSLGNNGERLSDAVKFNHGGNPFSDDTDSDGIPDSDECDDTGEIGQTLITQDLQSPGIEIDTIMPGLRTWSYDVNYGLGDITITVPIGLKLTMKIIVQDESGIGEVKVRIDFPIKKDWQTVTPESSDGYKATYIAVINLDLANAYAGAYTWFDLDVKASDNLGNSKEASARFNGIIGAAVDVATALIEIYVDTVLTLAEAVMDAVNWIVDWVKEQVQWIYNNLVEPIINGLEGLIGVLLTSICEIISTMNAYSDVDSETPQETIDALNDDFFDIIRDVVFSLIGEFEPIFFLIDALSILITLASPYMMLINPITIVGWIMSVLPDSASAIMGIFSSITGTITNVIIDGVLDFLFGDGIPGVGSIASIMGLDDITISSDDSIPDPQSIINFILYSGLFPDNSVLHVIAEYIDDNSGGRGGALLFSAASLGISVGIYILSHIFAKITGSELSTWSIIWGAASLLISGSLFYCNIKDWEVPFFADDIWAVIGLGVGTAGFLIFASSFFELDTENNDMFILDIFNQPHWTGVSLNIKRNEETFSSKWGGNNNYKRLEMISQFISLPMAIGSACFHFLG